jgi:hypothetical protein
MKTLKKMVGSKKAFSAIIASLILMLLAVAAGVVVYAYVMGWIGGATTNPQHNGHIAFDSIYASATTGTIGVYVRNVGGVNVMISKVYVNGANVANATGIVDAGVLLSVQAVTYLNVTYSLTTSQSYTVQVTCKDGTTASQSVVAQ